MLLHETKIPGSDESAGSALNYGVLLVDPPWHFKTYSTKGSNRSPEYATMDLAALKQVPLPALQRDACLFMWIVDSHMPQALELMAAWGFTYKTVAFVWTKPRIGLGYWTRKQAELCLLGTRGKPKRLGKGVKQHIHAAPREHSRKPDVIYGRIEALVTGPYCELFARTRWPNWDQACSNQPDMFALACGSAPPMVSLTNV